MIRTLSLLLIVIFVAGEVALAQQEDVAKINLAGLPTGRYILEVTVEDRTSNKRVSQQTPFYIGQ